MPTLFRNERSVPSSSRISVVHCLAKLVFVFLTVINAVWAAPPMPELELMVTNTSDDGAGSLRQAIHQANTHSGPVVIRFDAVEGPFTAPQEITLKRSLPPLRGELTIDGYIEDSLWKATGVTISGNNEHAVFTITAGSRVALNSLTIARGLANRGGGITSHGELIIKGVTFAGNSAVRDGGALANLGGTITIINSTFIANHAADTGGAIANLDGAATVTNCTFSGNAASKGGALFSAGTLLLRNTILANSEGTVDCVVDGILDPASTHNLIETHTGCGQPISSSDPRLGKPGAYNGPTATLPLGGGSPAINLGDNAAAVDAEGEPLRWDQRGNGDPRYVGGITDIGAFERQALPVLVVDTIEDIDLRACTRGAADCSLRGAITLANSWDRGDVITFDPKVFSETRAIVLQRSLPEVVADLTLDASETADVVVIGNGTELYTAEGVELVLHGVRIE